MKIEHVEEFIDLSSTLNFTHTAKRFFMTQPVLSKHIATLERELGGQLFDRSGQGIRLTPFGKAMLPAARALVGDRDRLLSEASNFASSQISTMKVGYLQGAAGPHIPEIQRRFCEMHPDISVNYLTYEFDQIVDALNDNAIDLAIGAAVEALDSDEFVQRAVYEDSYFALVSADDALAALRSITPSDLSGRDVVIPDESFFGRDVTDMIAWLAPKANHITVMQSVHDINAAPLSVKINNAVCLTFGHLAPYYGTEFELVPIEDFDNRLEIAVIYRQSVERPHFNDFANIVSDVIEEFGY